MEHVSLKKILVVFLIGLIVGMLFLYLMVEILQRYQEEDDAPRPSVVYCQKDCDLASHPDGCEFFYNLQTCIIGANFSTASLNLLYDREGKSYVSANNCSCIQQN